MEKKKLLLVAVTVGVFLTIVISASILIFAPKTQGLAVVSSGNVAGFRAVEPAFSAVQPIAPGTSGTQPVDTQPQQPASVDAADLVRNPGGMQTIQTPPSATAIQETNFYINGMRPLDSYQIEEKNGDAAAKVVINIPKPSAAAVPDTSFENRSAPAARPATTTRAAETPRPAARPAPPPQAAPKPVERAKPASQPAPAPRTYNDYWVQTGAFSAKTNAENVKETLSGKGITSIIENREVDGKTWYRVRVGPYTSETEANYWLALVKNIDGFADSQVRQTRSVR
ncbi:MAG TPA: hypothetical protein DEQ14_11320, partial [Treponema sp.]|nr:hypothetical protein [Treponema sp.]